MKLIRLLAILAALGGFTYNSHAVAATFGGPVTFKFIGSFTGLESASSKTNSSSTVTNIVEKQSVTASNATINNVKLLQMLMNSFNTTFPSGAVLGLDTEGQIVVAVGTNVVQSVSSVLSLTTSNLQVTVGSAVITEKIDHTGPSETTAEKITVTFPASLDYDDSALVTGDGTATRFSAKGFETEKASINGPTSAEKVKAILTFSGAGGGSVSNNVANNRFVIHGALVGSVSATE
jgi:hypothetical protein